MEPREAAARVPVLRHGVAVRDRPGIGHDRGDRSRRHAARAAGRAARLADGDAQRAVPELQGGDGVRPGSASARTASSAARRRWSLPGDQGAHQAAEPAAVPRAPRRQVRETIRRWYASKWFAPGALKLARARRHGARASTCPYWTFDAQVHCPWRAEAGHYYYIDRDLRDNQGRAQTRQVQHVRWEPAQAQVDHFFDDEPVPGTQGVNIAPAEGRRAVPDEGARALRHGVSVRLRRRALPGGARRRGASVASEQMNAQLTQSSARSRSQATPSATCEIAPQFSDRDVQAHPRAGLAARPTPTARRRSRWW